VLCFFVCCAVLLQSGARPRPRCCGAIFAALTRPARPRPSSPDLAVALCCAALMLRCAVLCCSDLAVLCCSDAKVPRVDHVVKHLQTSTFPHFHRSRASTTSSSTATRPTRRTTCRPTALLLLLLLLPRAWASPGCSAWMRWALPRCCRSVCVRTTTLDRAKSRSAHLPPLSALLTTGNQAAHPDPPLPHARQRLPP
jgi:hypothetical protein